MSVSEVITLGCRLNAAESDRIRAMLDGRSDTVVVNSCAVTEEAVRQTRRAVRRLRRRHPDARLLVTGCAADIEAEQLAAMPEVDALVPNSAKLEPASWGAGHNAAVLPPIKAHRGISTNTTPRTRGFVAVQTGCDHACTFCVIPQGRGASRSLTVPQVLGEIEAHLEQGAQEIVLTGVDVTSWGHDLPGSPSLGQLVGEVLHALPALPRLRLSSIDGAEIDEGLEELVVGEDRVMPHLHLSLQHGHDLILKRMKRRHSRTQAVDLVQRLQARRSDIAIGADLIAGFPTEDAAMHAENLTIVRECAVVHGHVFPYSPRPGTPAARMPQVDPAIVKARAADLRAQVAETRTAWLQSLVGSTLSVLAENDGTGHAPNFAPVRLPMGAKPGTIVAIRATGIADGQIIGELA
ncbi:MiaB/RimO family radical SAM methylthiotransferase [Croceicoccus naphthovorans]|uniref:2-methylthioadenine synthase n=1 Tax=Croceicoccus naphthovorans TaxID=1348774 RepID=A0A0G3XIZ1_9SPHN|nr:MiaB/RimO family radical SAM methylthiotransferase [Croceicoccus naphthovorans]AKM10576.1 2-methylthioadenine synthase [Croceicoccus naphthovorans]MBB3988790.1 threonylcarbamoyladenosine tRNA methylthiotransferase MtaB [Croceicoccus naphthovorans]